MNAVDKLGYHFQTVLNHGVRIKRQIFLDCNKPDHVEYRLQSNNAAYDVISIFLKVFFRGSSQ